MSQWSDSVTSTSERDQLSALMDGELDESEIQRACAQWRDESDFRARWHVYQLIGDILRSDELAASCRGDAAFLSSLRGRLANEPVVLAPHALQQGVGRSRAVVRRTRAWIGSAAVAAGFAAVIGVVIVTQTSESGTADGVLAQGNASPGPALVNTVDVRAAGATGAVPYVAEPRAVVLNDRLIRDARLDEYLAAHKKFGGSSAPGAPSGFLRNAAADGTGR